MTNSILRGQSVINFTCILYILLFAYAAGSKILDYENFQVQLGQSPLIGIYAGWLAWVVPASELTIAFALCFGRFKFCALFAGYVLMVLFTVYIVFIMNFSSFIPCSCGGILESMGWGQHLVFNIVFVILAIVGLFYVNKIGDGRNSLKKDL